MKTLEKVKSRDDLWIMPGGEPFYFNGGEPGCLLVHGFTASPQEMRWLGEHLTENGYSVLGVRLSGHGTHPRDMERSRWRDWMASVEDGYHQLLSSCSSVVLIGFSLGGALSLLFASYVSTPGVIAMSTPNRLPSDPRLRLLHPFLRPLSYFIHCIPKGSSHWYDPEAEGARVAYDCYPVRSLVEMDEVLGKMRSRAPTIDVPTLFIHSKNDLFVTPEHMVANYDLLSTEDREMLYVEGSNHIITCDAARDQVFAAVSSFVRRVSEPSS
ncbi:MAG: alpha/beta fold hydrolase [Anaerolineales bacterium]|nr:alpha/beta fold hydrolase [Anaerolineales bacterium]